MRILSLHPSTTELVFALGAGGMLVGRTERCDTPEAALRVPPISDPSDRGMIGAFEPDLILLGRGQESLDGTFAPYPTFLLSPKTVEQLLLDIRELARLLEKTVEGDMLLHDLIRALQRLEEKAKRFRTVKIYFEVGHQPPTGSSCYLRELLVLAGGEPLAGEVSPEMIARFDPQTIIVSVDGEGERFSPEIIAARPGWEHLRAVKQERVLVLDDGIFYRPGPRLIEGIRRIGKVLHGIEV